MNAFLEVRQMKIAFVLVRGFPNSCHLRGKKSFLRYGSRETPVVSSLQGTMCMKTHYLDVRRTKIRKVVVVVHSTTIYTSFNVAMKFSLFLLTSLCSNQTITTIKKSDPRSSVSTRYSNKILR